MMMTKLFGMTAAAALGLAMVCSAPASANLLTDPGFEGALTFDGPPFVGSWEGFNNGLPNTTSNGTTTPLSGAQHLELSLVGTNGFAGAFQDIPGLSAGQQVTWSGWTLEAVGSVAGGSEIRIEWRDSVNNVEISRTPNTVGSFVQGQYTPWSVVDVVPAGADTARVVYAIQSFGAGVNQLHYVDDTSVTVIPEPASLALLGLGGLAMLRRRA